MGVLCQRCKQANATVHLTDIQPDDEPVERHLCEACATQEGVTMKPHEPANAMLEKFVKMGMEIQTSVQKTCPKCGLNFGEFRTQGLLGCPHDYEEFRELLLPMIERAHDGGTIHVGKRPGQTNEGGKRRSGILQLRHQLAEAVQEEHYEKAAALRDKLSELEAERKDER